MTPSPAVAQLGLPVDAHGRVRVGASLLVEGRTDIWAIGDCAAVPNPADRGRPCPPTAQHAMRQGTHAARNVAAALGHGRRRPFRFRTIGLVVDLGRRQAVAKILGVKLRGSPAWSCARGYHLMAIPGVGRRLRLLIDWTVDLLLPAPLRRMDPAKAAAALARGVAGPRGRGGLHQEREPDLSGR